MFGMLWGFPGQFLIQDQKVPQSKNSHGNEEGGPPQTRPETPALCFERQHHSVFSQRLTASVTDVAASGSPVTSWNSSSPGHFTITWKPSAPAELTRRRL